SSPGGARLGRDARLDHRVAAPQARRLGDRARCCAPAGPAFPNRPDDVAAARTQSGTCRRRTVPLAATVPPGTTPAAQQRGIRGATDDPLGGAVLVGTTTRSRRPRCRDNTRASSDRYVGSISAPRRIRIPSVGRTLPTTWRR